MQFCIAFDSNRANSLKELIVTTLASEWPLSVKQIYSRISRNKIVSYQAVHNEMHRLLLHGFVVKEDRFFKLNKNWLFQMKSFSENVMQSYERYSQKILPIEITNC